MKRPFRFALVALVAVFASLVPRPALSLTPPETLAAMEPLGRLHGRSEVVTPDMRVDYLGVSWLAGEEPSVRFRVEGVWSDWLTAHEDGLAPTDGRTFSGLLAGGGADAFQVRGVARGVRAVAINTSDGPRSLVWREPEAEASHLLQPLVVSRTEWFADESYRFRADGTEKWPPAFYPTQKLIIHHTVTQNADPDPAATVRAIYRYHAIDRGYGDIAYNFLVDEQGRIYKGRYSGPGGTSPDTPTGEDAQGYGVTAAHTGGWNSGTMGIALLGTFTSVAPTTAARQALIDHLAWESEHHGLDPLATTTFTNPVSGKKKTVANISGHRDWGSTACPGGVLYADLPNIRNEVAAKTGPVSPAPEDRRPPRIKGVDESGVAKRSAVVQWSTNEPADSQLRYKRRGKGWRDTELNPRSREAHRVRLRGLKPAATYAYRARSADTAGNVGWSRSRTFGTVAA